MHENDTDIATAVADEDDRFLTAVFTFSAEAVGADERKLRGDLVERLLALADDLGVGMAVAHDAELPDEILFGGDVAGVPAAAPSGDGASVEREWSHDLTDEEYDAPCPECGKGPLDVKGYGFVCPDGHIIDSGYAHGDDEGEDAAPTTYTWGYHSSDEQYVHVSRVNEDGSVEDLFDVTLYDPACIEPSGLNAIQQSLIDLKALIAQANSAVPTGGASAGDMLAATSGTRIDVTLEGAVTTKYTKATLDKWARDLFALATNLLQSDDPDVREIGGEIASVQNDLIGLIEARPFDAMVGNVVFDDRDEDLALEMSEQQLAGHARRDGDVFWFDTVFGPLPLHDADEEPLYVLYGNGDGVRVYAPGCAFAAELERRLIRAFGEDGWTLDDHDEAAS